MVPPPRGAGVVRAPAIARPTGANGGDADNTAALAPLDARLAAAVTRAPTPDEEALEQQREAFDMIAKAQAEAERETNVLRDLAVEQMKHDDELLKKWIELI